MSSTGLFPTGWYVVELASSLAAGEGRKLPRLGGQVEVARARDGSVAVVDDAGRELVARERADMILAWSGEGEPWFEIERFPELARPDWSPIAWHRSRPIRTSVENAMRDVADNGHFEPVHGLHGAETRIEPDGRFLDVQTQGILDTSRWGAPPLKGHIRLDGRLHGPGLLTYRTTITLGIQIRNLVFSAATPIDAERIQMFAGVSIRRLPWISRLVQRRMVAGLAEDYERDAGYWETSGRFPQPQAAPEQDEAMDRYDAWLAQYREA